jgi:hypothetical protein
MEKVLLISIIITAIFGLLKFIEMKYIDRHLKPLKEIIRDIFMVFLASFGSLFVLLNYQHKLDDFLSVVTNTAMIKPDTTQVFTGIPDF